MHYELVEKVDLDKLLLEYYNIIKLVGDTKYQQIMIQGCEGISDHQFGTGSLIRSNKKVSEFKEFLWNTPYLNSLLRRMTAYRSRIMSMNKNTYSWHRDRTHRIHIPLISNTETNFMVVQDEVIRMEPGNMYIVDTTFYHTYVNTSDELRVHIVGCLS